jgi:hypothetical protein
MMLLGATVYCTNCNLLISLYPTLNHSHGWELAIHPIQCFKSFVHFLGLLALKG